MATRLYSPNFRTTETMLNLKNIGKSEFVIITDMKDSATALKMTQPVDLIPAKGDWIRDNYDALEKFKKVYLLIKDDKHNLSEIVDRLGYGRCYVMGKDTDIANVEVGKEQAYQIRPRDLITTDALKSRLRAVMNPMGGRLSGVDSCFIDHYGRVRFHDGEMTLWAGYNGGGKTAALLQQISHWIIEEGRRVLLASMEITSELSLKIMLNQATNSDPLSGAECDSASDYLAGRLWLFDVTSGVKYQVLLDRMEYARKRYDVTVFVIDSFTKCGVRAGDIGAEKEFAEKLSDWSREHNCQVHVVAHVRKPDSRGNEEDPEMKIPTKYDVRGAGEIVDFAANIMVVWRNAVKKNQRKNVKKAIDLIFAGKTVDLETNKRFRVSLPQSGETLGKGKIRFSLENAEDLKKLAREIENINDAIILTQKSRLIGTDDHELKVWFNPQTRRFSENRLNQTCKVYDWLGKYNDEKVKKMVREMDYAHDQLTMVL
jgi:hypothetical protein